MSRALTTKPLRSAVRTLVLPRTSSANRSTVWQCLPSVSSVGTISIRRIELTGLKKWVPTTRSGCAVPLASLVIDKAEVVVPSIASDGRTLSRDANTSRFASSSSTTASKTTSRSAKLPRFMVTDMRPRAASLSSSVIRPFATCRSNDALIRRGASTREDSRDTARRTSRPRRAQSSAIPPPIVPEPTTPTRVSGRL